MIIHKGNKYTITADGITARKSDGTSTREMKYFPERDASAIAGEIDELTAWRILRDIAAQISGMKTPVSPEHILIDGEGFVLSEWSRSIDPRYTAPEGYEPVWALASTLFFIFLGCDVFQGLGGRVQGKETPIPTLRRELPQLSRLIVRCLDCNPKLRPSLSEIKATAQENLDRCLREKSEFPPLKQEAGATVHSDEIDILWPENFD